MFLPAPPPCVGTWKLEARVGAPVCIRASASAGLPRGTGYVSWAGQALSRPCCLFPCLSPGTTLCGQSLEETACAGTVQKAELPTCKTEGPGAGGAGGREQWPGAHPSVEGWEGVARALTSGPCKGHGGCLAQGLHTHISTCAMHIHIPVYVCAWASWLFPAVFQCMD